LQSKALKKL